MTVWIHFKTCLRQPLVHTSVCSTIHGPCPFHHLCLRPPYMSRWLVSQCMLRELCDKSQIAL